MSPMLTLPAPAKLNLFLHITGRRDDGYHTLQTLFQFLDFGDSLSFQLDSGTGVRLSPDLPGFDPAENLVVKAANKLRSYIGSPPTGVTIHLDKRIPMGGGLGGGSSDAATTLLALNRLWGLDLHTDELASVGLELGADVPVFVRGHAAWAEGIGEQITPASPVEDWYLVLIPPCTVNTAQIFRHERLTRNSKPIRIAPAFDGNHSDYRNDCEALVCELYPAVEQALQWLRSECGNARLTGTGACIFSRFPTESGALAVLRNRPSGIKGFVAKGLNSSPLHNRLTELL
ncbi:4-(cytidine 5'-diphospho)-2-C-methyl-D-erythritol kinase [Hydrocarboniclastica marina]|uniref:4-diphosphocytidyl-2-C-methyl-D-erythritol kinase n=2 Tax=Hydrocarboniclastica marina TaxID=2259620 RepID=A0A4P7XKQ8_9ALTE|nr:4-(cytidine 5'-diphospho)-2-C-methyl-D-erythritol kinase [Hydrocarboniclastica marina]